MQNRRSFIDFLSGTLRLNPMERWTPQQALQHPFISQKPFLEPFVPMRSSVKMASLLNPLDTKNSQFDPYQQSASALRHKSGQSKKDSYTFQQQPVEKSVIDNRYNQVIGTFSEFQIDTTVVPLGVPDQSTVPKPYDFVHGSSYTSQSYQPNQWPTQGQVPGQTQIQGPYSSVRKSNSQTFSNHPAHPNAQGMQHYNSSPNLNTHYYGQEMAEGDYIEGHPRYGDQGERLRIPSRLPSAATSVDWEPFRDYQGGASLPGSYASSRQGSFSDISLPDGRRQVQAMNSPSSYRQMGFSGRKLGSFSNDSFVNDASSFNRTSSFGTSSESLRAPAYESYNLKSGEGSKASSATSSPRQSVKTHKKVKSTSSFGSPIVVDSSNYARRPSVPSSFYIPSQNPSMPPLQRQTSIPGSINSEQAGSKSGKPSAFQDFQFSSSSYASEAPHPKANEKAQEKEGALSPGSHSKPLPIINQKRDK